MHPTRPQILKLYKTLLRASTLFTSYNFRTYTFRRIRDTFRQNTTIDVTASSLAYQNGLKMLALIKRQAFIDSEFRVEKLVVEEDDSYSSSRSLAGSSVDSSDDTEEVAEEAVYESSPVSLKV